MLSGTFPQQMNMAKIHTAHPQVLRVDFNTALLTSVTYAVANDFNGTTDASHTRLGILIDLATTSRRDPTAMDGYRMTSIRVKIAISEGGRSVTTTGNGIDATDRCGQFKSNSHRNEAP